MLEMILDSLRVITIPTTTNFRGINHREIALFKGEQGWAEFSPFLEYDDQECVPWLECAIEAATMPTPTLHRSTIAMNGTIPAINDRKKIEEFVALYPGVKTFKIKMKRTIIS